MAAVITVAATASVGRGQGIFVEVMTMEVKGVVMVVIVVVATRSSSYEGERGRWVDGGMDTAGGVVVDRAVCDEDAGGGGLLEGGGAVCTLVLDLGFMNSPVCLWVVG